MAIPDTKVIDISSQPTSDWQRNWRKKLLWIVLIAFLLRVAAIGITHTYRPRTSEAQLRLWLGDGTHRPLDRRRRGLFQPLYADRHRPHRVGAAHLPVLHGGRIQGFRYLHASVGIRAAHGEFAVLGPHLHSRLPARAPDLRTTCRALVGMGLGLVSVCDVLVREVALGNKHHGLRARVPDPADHGSRRRRRLHEVAWLGTALGIRSPAESGSAVISTLRRIVAGMAPQSET